MIERRDDKSFVANRRLLGVVLLDEREVEIMGFVENGGGEGL